MWGGAEEKDSIAAIHASIDGGATSIDTAAVYAYGKSEELVGKAIKGKRDKVQVLTKYGLRWDTTEGEHFSIGPMRKPAKRRSIETRAGRASFKSARTA